MFHKKQYKKGEHINWYVPFYFTLLYWLYGANTHYSKGDEGSRSDITRGVGVIALVIVAGVYAFHIGFAVGGFRSQGRAEEIFDFGIHNGAALHGEEVETFINLAPIHNFTKFLFEDAIKPDAGGAAVALAEGVGDIHLNVFGADFIKSVLGHFINLKEGIAEVEAGGKAKVAFREVNGAKLPGKIINIAKEIGVDLLKAFKGANFKSI